MSPKRSPWHGSHVSAFRVHSSHAKAVHLLAFFSFVNMDSKDALVTARDDTIACRGFFSDSWAISLCFLAIFL